MSWTQLDIAFKTLLNKRQSDSNKQFYEEFGDLTINTHVNEVWFDLIPTDASSVAGVITWYNLLTLKVDPTVSGSLTWATVTDPSLAFNFSISDDPTNPRLKDWVSDKYGSGYDLQLFSNGTQISKSSATYPWRFNYATGELTFNTSVPATPIQIKAYRYIGRKGPAGIFLKEASIGSGLYWNSSTGKLDVSVGGNVTAANIGSGDISVYAGTSAGQLQFKTLVGSGAATLTQTVNTITIGINASFGGEVNTASNLGTGIGIYSQKIGSDLQFKSLKSQNNNIAFSIDASQVYLDVSGYVSKTAVDSSLSYLVLRLNTTDVSLSTLFSRHNTTESSLGNLSQGKFDASILGLTTRIGSVEGSLGTLTRVLFDASLNNVYTRINASDNAIWVKLGSVDTSLNLLEPKADVDASFNLMVPRTVFDASLVKVLSLSVKEASLGTDFYWAAGMLEVSIVSGVSQSYIDGSFAFRDTSIFNLGIKNANQDISINDVWTQINNIESSLNGGLPINSYVNSSSYYDASLSARLKEASLGPDFFWSGGYLEVSVGGNITASNIGSGDISVYAGTSGSNLQFKTLVGSGAATVTQSVNTITIGINASFGGEVNTASNLGTGIGLYLQKVGSDLQFKSLKSQNNNIAFSIDASQVYLDVSGYVSKTAVDSSLSYLVLRLNTTDVSLSTLFSRHNATESSLGNLSQGKFDTSITGLTTRISSVEGSLGTLTRVLFDASLNNVYTRINASDNAIWVKLGNVDTSLNLMATSATRDACDNALWVNFGSYATNSSVGTALGSYATNASIGLAAFAKNASLSLYTLLTVFDSSIGALLTRENTTDASLNTLKARYDKTEASLGNLTSIKFDASIAGLTTRIGSVEGSLGTLTRVLFDASLNNVYTRINSSDNAIWVKLGSVDTSLLNLGVKNVNQDISINNLQQYTEGSINTDIQKWIDINRTGFVNEDLVSVGYNSTTYVVTLQPVGSSAWTYFQAGKEYTITHDVSVQIGNPPAKGHYYITITGNDGALTTSLTPWTLLDSILPVASILIDASTSPVYQFAEEKHQALIDRRIHYYLHSTRGTQYISGGQITGPTIGGTTNLTNVFSIAQTVIADEDMIETLPALATPDGSSLAYTCFYRTNASTWTWIDSSMPYLYGATNDIMYDFNGTLTETTANNQWVNWYLLFTNLIGRARYVLIPGRSIFTSLANAQAENIATFDFLGFPIAESLIAYQMTWEHHPSAPGPLSNLGRARLAATPVRLNVGNVSVVGSGATTSHNTLSGLQGGTASEYYHLTSAEYTTLGTYATNSSVGTALDSYATNASIGLAAFAKNASLTSYTLLSVFDSSIGALLSRENATDTSLNTLKARYDKTEASLGNLTQGKFDTSIAGLTTRIGSVEGSLGTLTKVLFDSSISNLTTRVSNLETSIGAYATNASINTALDFYVSNASLGTDFYWSGGLLEVSVGGSGTVGKYTGTFDGSANTFLTVTAVTHGLGIGPFIVAVYDITELVHPSVFCAANGDVSILWTAGTMSTTCKYIITG